MEEIRSSEDFRILEECDREFEAKNPSFFVGLLRQRSSIAVRIRAVTILAEIGDELSVSTLSKVVRSDSNPLVRHEAAFTMGQLGYSSAVPALVEAMLKDDSILVRHESAAALGSIGAESARHALEKAAQDSDEFVAQSALVSLLNLDYLKSRRGRPLPTLRNGYSNRPERESPLDATPSGSSSS